MNRRSAWYMGVALAALMTGLAIGQQLTPSGLSGNETWSVATGGPGGSSVFVTSNHMRNTSSYALSSTTTGAVTPGANTVATIFTAALTGAITFNAPGSPLDGQKISVSNGTAAAFTQTITLTAAAGQTVVNGACAADPAGTTCAWIYVASNTTWYRIQ